LLRRTPVNSSTLKSAGYDNSVLEIEFQDGSVYRYFGVPVEVAQAFMASTSKGQHFVAFIRGQYEFEKAEPEAPQI
jgi:hypothetical protein